MLTGGKNIFSHSKTPFDKDYITLWYHNYVNDLFKWGRTYTNDLELIKDCIQDLFVYLLRNKSILNEINNQKVYLFQSLRNNLINRLREENLTERKDGSKDQVFLELTDPSPDPEYKLENEEYKLNRKKLLNRLFDTLTSNQKRIIHLRFYQQMEYDEICEVLQLNYQSARTLTYRAICRMRRVQEEMEMR